MKDKDEDSQLANWKPWGWRQRDDAKIAVRGPRVLGHKDKDPMPAWDGLMDK